MNRILANQRIAPRLPLQIPPSGPIALPPPVERYRPRLSLGSLFALLLSVAMVAMVLAVALIVVRAVGR